jgi:hypothetical protein
VSDIKVWFDEYQILLDNYKNWQELVKKNIQKSKRGLVFVNKLYLQSEICRNEYNDLLSHCGSGGVIIILLEDEEISDPITKKAKWSFCFAGSKTINDLLFFIESIIAKPIQKVNIENIWSGEKKYHIGKCLGFPYRLDISLWNYHRSLWLSLLNIYYKISKHFIYRIIEKQRISMNLYFGPEISPVHMANRIKRVVDDRKLQDEMRRYAKTYFDRWNTNCIGIHLVPHHEFMQFAFSYQLGPGLWSRKYSISLPISNQVVEFAFTFGVLGSFTDFCRVAWLCDQLVTSLEWPIRESESASDLTKRAFAWVQQGREDLAIVFLERAIKINPKLGDAYNELAFIYGKIKNNLGEAEKYAELATKSNPSNPKFANTLINIRLNQIKQLKSRNEIKIAIKSYLQELDKQIQKTPDYPGLYITKAQAMALIGKPKATWEQQLKKVKELYREQGVTGSGIPFGNLDEIDSLIKRYEQECINLNSYCKEEIKLVAEEKKLNKEGGDLIDYNNKILKKRNLTYPRHYEETVRQAFGEKCELTLIHADVRGPHFNLVYQWESELSYEEADRLDSRARAYISCAIYDAATAVGLSCQPDLPHGQRPSWCIEDERMITLVNAGFDVSNKTCFMQIGPGIFRTKESLMAKGYCKGLIEGFQTLFRKIKV